MANQDILRKRFELAKLEGKLKQMWEFGRLIVQNFSTDSVGSEPNIDGILEKQKQLVLLQNELEAAIQKQQLLNERERILEDITFWEEAKGRQRDIQSEQ